MDLGQDPTAVSELIVIGAVPGLIVISAVNIIGVLSDLVPI